MFLVKELVKERKMKASLDQICMNSSTIVNAERNFHYQLKVRKNTTINLS